MMMKGVMDKQINYMALVVLPVALIISATHMAINHASATPSPVIINNAAIPRLSSPGSLLYVWVILIR